MGDLPVQVGRLDNVTVREADGADPGSREIRGGGTAKPAGSDNENGRSLYPQLT